MAVAFWISTSKTVSEIKQACALKDAAKVADLAHKLKSPAKSVGAFVLAGICEEMQKAAGVADFAALDACAPRLEAEKTRVFGPGLKRSVLGKVGGKGPAAG